MISKFKWVLLTFIALITGIIFFFPDLIKEKAWRGYLRVLSYFIYSLQGIEEYFKFYFSRDGLFDFRRILSLVIISVLFSIFGSVLSSFGLWVGKKLVVDKIKGKVKMWKQDKFFWDFSVGFITFVSSVKIFFPYLRIKALYWKYIHGLLHIVIYILTIERESLNIFSWEDELPIFRTILLLRVLVILVYKKWF